MTVRHRTPKIEKGIPPPPPRGRKWDWLLDMEPGDSALMEDGSQYDALRCSARRIAQLHGLKFRMKSEKGGLRIWRVK